MTYDEVKKTCEDLKKQGYSNDDIERAFGILFVQGTIDLKQLQELYTILGIRLKDEFLSLSPEDQKAAIIWRWNLGKTDDKKNVQ